MESTTTLPTRHGPRPDTIGPRPHAQVSEPSPPEIHRTLAEWALELPGVNPAESQVSVPGALAFVLDEATAGGPPEAFQAGREFAHLHPQEDGSLHMMLPPEVAAEALRMLAPICNWFSEGLETADVKEAKALLDELL